MKVPLTLVSKIARVIAGAAWFPLAVALTILSQGGVVAIGLPVTVAWLLAGGVTLASSAFAGLARATGSLLYGGFAVATVVFLAAFDYLNVVETLRSHHLAPVQVETAAVGVQVAEADRLKAEVASLENDVRTMRSRAESERLGLSSGKPGEGPEWKLLVAQTEALEGELLRKHALAASAVTELARAERAAAMVAAGVHLLADVSPWVLLVAAVILEAVVAGLAWGMGEGAAGKQPTPQVIVQNISRPQVDTVDENEPLSTDLRRKAARVEQRCRRAGY